VTQHEYIYVAVSIILGLAITRLLHNVAMLIRAHRRVRFHWSTALWAVSVLAYALQLWWVGWGLHEKTEWTFVNFLMLVTGSICIYGAAEMAMPGTEDDRSLDFLEHSQRLGRLSALSMLVYFLIGPYFNLVMADAPVLPSLLASTMGVSLMSLVIFKPSWFKGVSVLFALYSLGILYITA
jgi:zinc transporter ZupT